jgi:hypothetical protein
MNRFEAVDLDWLNAEISARDSATARVSGIDVEPVAFSGATTEISRLRLTYAGPGDPGASTMVGKLRGTSEVMVQMDAAMGLFEREGRFYDELADRVPIGTPRCYAIGDGDRTPLLLEDLSALRMGDQIEGLSVSDAEATIDALADMHAAFWGRADAAWLAAPASGAFAAMICQLVASGAPALAERYRGEAPDQVLEAIKDVAPHWQRVLDRCAEGPPTLVHNDCRLDNIFFDLHGAPILIDWQLAARSRGTQDIGNLLAGSMTSDDLSAHWEALLRRYHGRLVERGVSGYSYDECLEHYRQSIIFPLGAGMALLGAMDIGDDRGLGDVIVRRCLQHIAELDAMIAIV